MNSVSKPASCAATPNQSRWLWMRSRPATISRITRPRRNFDSRQMLYAETVRLSVNVRTDPAHPLQQVEVLRPVHILRRSFDPAMCIPQTHRCPGYDLAVERELKMRRFLECRMLRSIGTTNLSLSVCALLCLRGSRLAISAGSKSRRSGYRSSASRRASIASSGRGYSQRRSPTSRSVRVPGCSQTE